MLHKTAKRRSEDSSYRTSEVVEWCPLCEKEGINTAAKFFQLNLEETLFACNKPQSAFPFAQAYVPVYIKRDFSQMSDPDRTPVVYMTDILRCGAHVAQTPTYLTRLPEKCSRTEVKDSSAGTSSPTNNINTTNSIKTYSTCNPEYTSETARKKAEEEVAKIMGDFSSVLDLCCDSGGQSEEHSQNISDKPASKPTPEFKGFVFTCSASEKASRKPRRRGNLTFASKKKKYKRKKAIATNEFRDSVVGTSSSGDKREESYDNYLSVTNSRSTADAPVTIEQTSFCESDTLNGFSDTAPTVDINHNDNCENKQKTFIELSSGSNSIITFPKIVFDTDRNTNCASYDNNIDPNRAIMSIESKCGAKNNVCDQGISDISIYRDMTTPVVEVGSEKPYSLFTGANCDEMLFAGVEIVEQPSQNCISVSRDNYVGIDGRVQFEQMGNLSSLEICGNDIERNVAVAVQEPSIPETCGIQSTTMLTSDSEIVNFVSSENCGKMRVLRAQSEEFMEMGRTGLIGFRYILALIGLSLPLECEYECGHLPAGLSALCTKISFYKPHLPPFIPKLSQLQCFTSEAHQETKGKALLGRNARRKKSSRLMEAREQRETSVLVNMVSHDVSLTGKEASIHLLCQLPSQHAVSARMEMAKCPPALSPGVPSTSSFGSLSVNNDMKEKQDFPSMSKLQEKIRLTEKDFTPLSELCISVW